MSLSPFEEMRRRLQKPLPSAISKDEKRKERGSTYAQNSRLARVRDGHHCRICGSQFNLETHHLVPRSLVGKALRNETSNLITLDRECHEQVTRHVMKLQPLDAALGANGKVRVIKWDKDEQGYVTVTEAA
jgi:5-methylcytosine-specific restriction endonuclease McrA